MKMKISAFLSAILMMSVLSSCSLFSGGGNDISATTGWAYNDPDNGAFEVAEYNEQTTGPGLVLIEGGRFTMGRTQQDVMYDWNNIPRTVTLASFYMDETEVRNVDYREYLFWIRRVYKSYPEVYQKAIPDTLVWRKRLAYNDPYVEYYFRHPAYHNYPVVGVSWVQANDYAAWRSDRVNEQLLVDEGILELDPNQVDENNFTTDAYLAGQYQGAVRDNMISPTGDERPVRWEDGILLPKYRLPTEAEWEYAALALIGNSVESPERIYSGRLYPWNGHFVRNPENGVRGLFMANFQRGRGDMMGVAGYLNDNAAITAPVDAYWPNDFGLYCMAGNVNEWVLDVYRDLSSTDVEGFRPFRGNIFMKKKTNKDGTLVQKDSLGRIIYEPISDEEAANRYNFTRADNRNYLDGDAQSSIVPGAEALTADDSPGSNRMYYQGKGPKKIGATSLVNDHARVYKGGSWRDRVYWLSPGTRRYLDQNKSTNDIGFRCAMIRVGSPAGN